MAEPPPGKHPAFIVRTHDPLNGGPPPDLIDCADQTPTDLFFVRNHGSIPAIDPAGYRLEVDGMVGRALSLSLRDLQTRFAPVTVAATLACAGNRRDELLAVAPIPGEVAWGAEAISNASWTGAPLAEVLRAAGVRPGAAHVAFGGLDEVERQGRRFGFGGSIALEQALGGDVLLAYAMNGEPLPATHGFPLRAVVPGSIGARSVKWLARITAQAAPSDNYFQAHAYKLFPADTRAETADWDAALMLGEQSLTSVICHPGPGACLPAGRVQVGGYAYAGGGRQIARVELSADGGASWAGAELLAAGSRWAWRRWRAEVELAPGPHELVVRAWDTAANRQPADPRELWNFKGYMNNSWHRVGVLAEG